MYSRIRSLEISILAANADIFGLNGADSAIKASKRLTFIAVPALYDALYARSVSTTASITCWSFGKYSFSPSVNIGR